MAHRGIYFREAKCTTLHVHGIHSETSVSLLLGLALEMQGESVMAMTMEFCRAPRNV